ncbi:hypothetical protein Rhopal_002716-T1 [Rhodotorula paludigena]|uniref:Nicotinamide N-methyltransferase n=1 Tax=Rhodotorula paludigena TaxID=86838 RepID=A0AAV5GK15_9BASI|nr:hypothetical protein Rhopal_002716-T1 [Rhodotorula paludigena]
MPPSACFPENYLSCSPSHGAPGHSFVWLSPLRAPSPLLLELPVPPARSRDKHAGTVWNAAIVLADKIAADEIDVRGRKVVELGAGLGLPGIVAARKGADNVLLTDYDDPAALADTGQAVREALSPPLARRVKVLPLSWGEPVDNVLEVMPEFDLILVADCVWDATLHQRLVTTLLHLLLACPTAVVHFTCGFHTGRRPVAQFLAAAARMGIIPLAPDEWVELSVEGAARLWNWAPVENVGRVRVKGEGEEKQEERNRWTLYGTLGLHRD